MTRNENLGATKLAIELGTPLHLEIEGVGARLPSELVGLLRDELLIVRPPKLGAAEMDGIGPGHAIIVRYVFAGIVYAFPTTMLAMLTTPAPLLLLGYPKVVATHPLRASKRVSCNLPMLLSVGPARVPGRIVDISFQGCQCIVAAREFDRGARPAVDVEIALHLKLPGVRDQLHVLGTVRSVKDDGDLLLAGIAFDALDINVHKAIEDFVRALEQPDP